MYDIKNHISPSVAKVGLVIRGDAADIHVDVRRVNGLK
jgi:hypothetical protein